MRLQGRNLSVQMQGEDVGLLQSELRQLGFAIPSEEVERMTFAMGTYQAVVELQKKYGLATTGVVDEHTANLLNTAVDALPPPSRFTVKGQVSLQDGGTLPAVTVKAFDKDLRREEQLGETTTDQRLGGGYEISYTTEQFRRTEKDNADLIVRVFDQKGTLLGASDVIFNAKPTEEVNLVVALPKTPVLSEFEKLMATLAPVLQGVQLADLTDEDVAFLVGGTGIKRPRIDVLRQAASLARQTNLPTEVFYGFARRDLPLNLDDLLAQKPDALRKTLEAAIKGRIIPAGMSDSLDQIMGRLEYLKLKHGFLVRRELVGWLSDQDTSAPLAGFTVHVADLDAYPTAQDLGYDITNAKGLFTVACTIPRKTAPSEDPVRRLRLTIVDPQGQEIDCQDLTVKADQAKVLDVPVHIEPIPEPPSPPLDALDLELSPELRDFLAAEGIRTLADIRNKGGLRNLIERRRKEGQSEERLPDPNQEEVRQLDRHADLNRFSSDVVTNGRLVDMGFGSALAIANATRAGFVGAACGELGDYKAAEMHFKLDVERNVFNNVMTGIGATLANRSPYHDPGLDGVFQNGKFDFRELFPSKCECKDCEAAVSPLAYLADLLDYALTHLVRRTDLFVLEPISLDYLTRTFHQPFGELPASCEAQNKQARQVRLCIEVLRAYLRNHPSTPAKQARLDGAERSYLREAYRTSLAKIGTSHEEMRRAHAADLETRQALAERLGIDLGPERPDHLDALLLTPPGEGPRPLTEPILEQVFGLADTSRDRLSEGAKWGDADPAQLTRWNLDGAEWNQNTDSDGNVYVSLTNPAVANYVVELYRDRARTSRVASGTRETSEGIVVLQPDNESGLSGNVAIRYTADTREIEISAIPELLVWRLQHLRTLWGEQDWPTDMYMAGETVAELATLPQGVVFPDSLPEFLKERINYSNQLLAWQAVMTQDDRTALLDLSLDPSYQAAIQTLFVNSYRLSAIDPDLIGPDDFRAPVLGNLIFDIWVRRRRWVDARIRELTGQGMRIEVTNEAGEPVPDENGNQVTVPDLDALLQRVTEQVTYSKYDPVIGALTDVSFIPWTDAALVNELDLLWHNLTEGVQLEATRYTIETDLALTVESFTRLMTIRDKHQRWINDPGEPYLEPQEGTEVCSILVQAQKVRFFREWCDEERAHQVLFGPKEFWISLREPEAGDWPPAQIADSPLIDPDLVKLKDLPEPTVGEPAIALWKLRRKELEEVPTKLRETREDPQQANGLETLLLLALGDPDPGPNRMDDLNALQTALTDPATDEQAKRRITDELHLASVEAFTRLLTIAAKDSEGSQSRPAAAEWDEVYGILARPYKLIRLYPVWLSEEREPGRGLSQDPDLEGGGPYYWSALKARLPAWRATAEARAAWQDALRVRSRPPLIDPDLIGPGDLRDPVTGPAAELLDSRYTSVSNRSEDLAATPRTLDGFDGLLVDTLFRTDEREAIRAGVQLARETLSLEYLLKRVLGDPPPDLYTFLDTLRADLGSADGDVANQALRTITQTLYLTRDGFDQLMATRDADLAGNVIPDQEWDTLYTTLTRATLLMRVLSLASDQPPEIDVASRLDQLSLSVGALNYLSRMRGLLASGASVLDAEWTDVASILVQVEKRRDFAGWRNEERDENLLHGPDYFKLPEPAALQFPPPPPEPLTAWRAMWSDRRDWQDTLQSRIDQEQATIDALQTAVSSTEEASLPALRDALIMASNAEGSGIEAKGKWLTDRLLIDARAGGCQKTTRVAQAIETLQGILWSVRTAQLNDTYPELELDADHFEEEWQWIGSYATWRSAMLVFLYPENILLPSLRPTKTPAFATLVENLRSNRRLTPEQACEAARAYADYFNDVCNLTVEATCQTRTRIHSGDCRDHTSVGYSDLLYMFARRGTTGKVYWSAYNPDNNTETAYSQTFWATVPGLDHANDIVGSVPYELGAEQRFIFLFALIHDKGEDKVLFTRYDLEQQSWDSEPIQLELPEGRNVLRIVAVQSFAEDQPPVLIIHTIDNIYERSLNPEGTDWQEPTSSSDGEGNDEDSGASDDWTEFKIRELSLTALHAALDVGDYLILLATHDDDLIMARVKYRTYYNEINLGRVPWRGVLHLTPEHIFDVFVYQQGETGSFYRLVSLYPEHVSGPHDAPAGLLRVIPAFGPIPSSNARHVVYHRQVPPPRFFRAVITRSEGILTEESRSLVAPYGLLPEIAEGFSEWELEIRRQHIQNVFEANTDGPPSNLTYLEEAFYFVPVHLALQLQACGQYTAALNWFRTVYDYSMPKEYRKIYWGLVQEELGAIVFERLPEWLRDPLNPHAIALTRVNTYTRFTMLSLVRCLLDYADAEFTRDTAESVPRARTLYMTALELLDTEPLALPPDACEDIIGSLYTEVSEARERAAMGELIVLIRGMQGFFESLSTLVEAIRQIMQGDSPWRARFAESLKRIAQEYARQQGVLNLAGVLEKRWEGHARAYAGLGAQRNFAAAAEKAVQAAGKDFLHAVSSVSGLDAATLEREQVELKWLRDLIGATNKREGQNGAPGANANILAGAEGLPGWAGANPLAPTYSELLAGFADKQPIPAMYHLMDYDFDYVPILSFPFCIPPNPVLKSLRLHAELNLHKLRTCRNIAGMQRQIEPYAAPTDTTSGLPMIGAGGHLILPGTTVLQATPYRYSALIERAKQLVQLAAQVEAAMLAALERRDAEAYQLVTARQNVQLARAGVRLQDLRLKEAEDGVKLAELQQQRAQMQVDTYQEWIDAELNQWEQAMIDGYEEAAQYQALAAGWATYAEIAQAAVTAAAGGMTGGGAAAAALPFVAFTLDKRLTATGAAIGAEKEVQIASVWASYERRKQEWELQQAIAAADKGIADQQITIAEDQVRIVGQERLIADMQADHAEVIVDFLANKFTNVDLYDWMSNVLQGVYSFFLSQATTAARLATDALAFERQETPPPFIQANYWEAPGDTLLSSGADGRSPDRRGLTGSARLLQDIYQLDQYAFDTNQNKLQLTKTISLARLDPAEFQRFRETGVMAFASTSEMFDREFPGHYLRLIHRVRTSVIALIPPTQGIRATLTSTGISRVVIGGDVFQTVIVRRDPESVALSSPQNVTGLFELEPQPEMRLPFEGLGVNTAWEFRMPKPANLFDYSTVADVLITIEYTALNSFDYQQQVIQALDPKLSADRPFSFRYELADQWYDLHNPDQTATPMVVRFKTVREDFPPNLEDVKIQQVLLYFARASGQSFEVPVTHLYFTEQGSAGTVGGESATLDGVISTRRGNAGSWTAMIGKAPIGEWELALPDSPEIRGLFANEQIDDILFVITYSGRTSEWPA